ncbi:hypothetical protein SLS60_010295 [Paraconiothyrium brasiliense]|uniref:Uncharacterized protein n=1 Tax=Paraconiothyrium brasiliense TaxID=300254 RepID=A0ABR3QQV4_9PLEO
MSSSSPTSPNRRKSDPVGGAASPERRRSSRVSSSKSKDEESAPKAKQPQLTNGVSSDDGENVSEPSAQDVSALSNPSPDNEGEKKSKPKKAAHKVKKTKKDNDADAEDNDNEDEEDTDDRQDNQTLANRFNPWKPVPRGEPFREPPFDDAWLRILNTRRDEVGNLDPLPDLSDQPPARTSNGQVVPPLWEDRGITFQRGRFIEQADGDRIDQDDHLVLKLIDMRPISKEDPTPRRQPTYWANKNGIPKDWDDAYMIKQLNGSHRDNIKTICHEPIWSQNEANFIAKQFKDNEDISIKELAYEFNNRFIGENPYEERFSWDDLHIGRTTESIRGEYLLHKELYDSGTAPKKTEIRDKKWKLANGNTFGEMMLEHMKKTDYDGKNAVKKAIKSNASDDEAGDQEELTLPDTADEYDRKTVKDLKKLADSTKPKGFLRGLTKKAEIVDKFKKDHPGNDNEAVEGNAAEDEEEEDDGEEDDGEEDDGEEDDDEEDDDEGPTEAELTANDGGIQVPKYEVGAKKGQPYYNNMKSKDIKDLFTNRGLQLPPNIGRGGKGKLKPRKEDYINILQRDDAAKGRYKKKNTSAKKKTNSSKSSSKTSANKKRNSSGSSGSVAKKQKRKESADAETGGEEDEEATTASLSKKRKSSSSSVPANRKKQKVATSSSSKRHSDTSTASPISPRKASLRSQSQSSPVIGNEEEEYSEDVGTQSEEVEVDGETGGETEAEGDADGETTEEETDPISED